MPAAGGSQLRRGAHLRNKREQKFECSSGLGFTSGYTKCILLAATGEGAGTGEGMGTGEGSGVGSGAGVDWGSGVDSGVGSGAGVDSEAGVGSGAGVVSFFSGLHRGVLWVSITSMATHLLLDDSGEELQNSAAHKGVDVVAMGLQSV